MFAAASSSLLAVQATPDLHRVIRLPRRAWSEDAARELAAKVTAVLRTPHGMMTLRPIQAVALYELAIVGGLFGALRVGAGKTLLSLLAPVVLESRRPLLLVPAKLVEKTKREARALAVHWRIPNFIRIESYEQLGLVQSAELLERYQPDLIVADEVHRLKNPSAARTKRVMRYLADHPECRLVAMSGTITRRSLTDYAHVLRRALGPERAPVPRRWTELEDWAGALDEMPNAETRVHPGALVALCGPEEQGLGVLDACRRAFRRRLVDTLGVVATQDARLACSLSIAPLVAPMSRATDLAFKTLREDAELPDGQPLENGLDLYRHARELGLGLFYTWDPQAPLAWMKARKRWFACCRYILSNNRSYLDSPLQVAQAIDRGYHPEPVKLTSGEAVVPRAALEAWRDIRSSFEPRTVPVWIDEGALHACATWAKKGPGILWTEHHHFALELSRRTGLRYFGAEGLDARGTPIEHASPKECVIASVASNGEGRNLQAWSRNLIASCPKSGATVEQLLGRTHRDGQDADEVTFEILVTCREHVEAFEQARADARYAEATTGAEQKILLADVVDMPRVENLR